MSRKRMEKIEEKLRLRERRYTTEQLMKHKRSEEWEVLEEVFDKPTLFQLYDFLNNKKLSKIDGVISAGKESKVFLGESCSGEEVAVKIFLTISTEIKKGILQYIEGDPRFPNIKKDTRSLIYLWARKEFKNLMKAYKAGIVVPKPITVSRNVLLMRFIGVNGTPAPLLKEVSNLNFKEIYKEILMMVKSLYAKAELVHADLSEYNIMIWKDHPVFIDFSQSIHKNHPSSHIFFRRDIHNINNFFVKKNVKTTPINKFLEQVIKCNE